MIAYINKSVNDRRNGVTSDKGFTLIELLVVVIIIGILAAIAIPMFLTQREGAWVSQVESDLKNASIAAESYANANNGSYAGLTNTENATRATPSKPSSKELVDFGFNPTEKVLITVMPSVNSYTLEGTNSNLDGKRVFTYSSITGKIVESVKPTTE